LKKGFVMPDLYSRKHGVKQRDERREAVRGRLTQKPAVPMRPKKFGAGKHGKRVVYVTPYANSAKEEAEKYAKQGIKAEIKLEKDDAGKRVYVVYIFE